MCAIRGREAKSDNRHAYKRQQKIGSRYAQKIQRHKRLEDKVQ